MKILVTGGVGFIGSHTVVELVNAGHIPVIVDTLENSQPWILDNLAEIIGFKPIFYKGDSADYAFMKMVVDQEKDIEGIIHFAAYKAVGESVAFPLKYYKNNLGSLVNILEIMRDFNIKHLAFSSSCTVYGQPDVLPVDESFPVVVAQSPYGNTKQISEEIIKDTVASGIPIRALSLRYFNPIGAHPSAKIGELPIGVPGNLVPFVTQTAIGWRECLSIFGKDYQTPDGTCIRDFIHVVDLAKAHVKAIEVLQKQQSPQWYDFVNLGTGEGKSVLEVVKTFEEVATLSLNYKFVPRRAGDVEKIYASTEKANQLLGWKTLHSLADSLSDAWRWQQVLNQKGLRP